IDGQALYVAYSMYSFDPDGTLNGCGCTFTNSALLIMNKSQLLTGTPNLASLYFEGGPSAQAVTPFGGSPGNVMYMARIWNSGGIKVYAVSDPLGARTLSSRFLSVPDRGGGTTNSAPQPGLPNSIDPINGRALGNASLVGGDMWFGTTRGQPGGPAVATYYRVRLNGWPASSSPTVAEEGTVGDSSYWNYSPAVGVNLRGDVAITWTRSSSSTFTTMMYAARNATDTAFGAPQVVKAS